MLAPSLFKETFLIRIYCNEKVSVSCTLFEMGSNELFINEKSNLQKEVELLL